MLVAVAHHSAQAIDRARLYESAQQARIDAEAANRSKDDFLSIVSHELRTPLTAVLGWASMLRKGGLDAPRTTRAVDAICSNATRQAQLIDELLDVSRLVGGRAVFELRDIDLRDTLRGVVEAVMPVAEAKGIELCLGAHPTVPVTADPRRLEQVFLNLLTNAVKFTPPGGRVTHRRDHLRQRRGGPRRRQRQRNRSRSFCRSSSIASGRAPTAMRTRKPVSDSACSSRVNWSKARAERFAPRAAGSGQGSTFVVTLPVTKSAPHRRGRRLKPPRV